MIIDEHLSFQSHKKYIKVKAARGFGILFKCRRHFSSQAMHTLYICFSNFPFYILYWSLGQFMSIKFGKSAYIAETSN